MRSIEISADIARRYQQEQKDISYVLSELLQVSGGNTAEIRSIPMTRTGETVSVEITDKVHNDLTLSFPVLNDVSMAAEILLWSQCFMGLEL